MKYRVPRIKIIKDQDPTRVEKLYAEWVDERIENLKDIKDIDISGDKELLGIPSQLKLDWSQGLQAFVLCVNYNLHPYELKGE